MWKISHEQAEDDVRKTMEVFQELGSKDQHLMYRVQADKERRINSLMWANGNSRLQYTFLCNGKACRLARLLPPAKRKDMARPTTSREMRRMKG